MGREMIHTWNRNIVQNNFRTHSKIHSWTILDFGTFSFVAMVSKTIRLFKRGKSFELELKVSS